MASNPPIVNYCMLALGASTLAPWLAYISAADFFIRTYPDDELMFIFPVQNFLVLVSGSLYLMWHGEKYPLNQRIVWPQLLLIVSLAVVPALNLLEVSSSMAVRCTLLTQALGAACVTIYQSASYGAGAMLGPSVTNTLEKGKGVGGLGIILARMFAKFLYDDTEEGLRASTNLFFYFSNGLVVASVVLWLLLLQSPHAAPLVEYEKQRVAKLAAASNSQPAGKGNGAGGSSGAAYASVEAGEGGISPSPQPQPSSSSSVGAKRGESSPLVLPEPPSGPTSSVGEVLVQVLRPASVVMVGFLVCLACFPGLTTSLTSRTLGLGDWFPVILVLCFNSFDLVGKTLPGYKLLFDEQALPWAALAHCGFIPLFVFVASAPSLEGPWGFMGSDEFACVLVCCLGLSTGYVTCSAMMLGPGCVAPQDRVLGGQMMTCCLMVGLFAGAMVGLALSVA